MMALSKLLEAGSIRPRVSRSFALDEFVDAFRTISERRATGKVVFSL